MTTPRATLPTKNTVSHGKLYWSAGGALAIGATQAVAGAALDWPPHLLILNLGLVIVLILLGWRAETAQLRAEYIRDAWETREMLDEIDEILTQDQHR
ncbi:hypothetical protein ACFWIW_11020 [Amycolatopsis sp. NPDC058340]|uniref:hypothetical protein n=1 Tax=Amycolatopsis sp. NPDC058340 TaxID=3346453 RepID=UPI00365270B0